MAQGDVVTKAEIVEWFKPLSFKPDENELDEFFAVINTMRVTQPRNRVVARPPELDRVAKSLADLSVDVPILMEVQKKAVLGAGDTAVVRDIARRIGLLQEFERLLTSVHALTSDPFFSSPTRKYREAIWHSDLHALVFLLNRSAKRCGTTVGLTKAKSPGVDFLLQALARVGIHPEPDAIAREIGRSKADTLRIFERP